jgi:hypothetical protein
MSLLVWPKVRCSLIHCVEKSQLVLRRRQECRKCGNGSMVQCHCHFILCISTYVLMVHSVDLPHGQVSGMCLCAVQIMRKLITRAQIIAFHAFDVLFLRRKQREATLWVTIVGTWTFIFCVDMFGPVFLQNPDQGPFFGISGYWCVGWECMSCVPVLKHVA